MSDFFRNLTDRLIETLEDIGLPESLNPEVRLAATVILVDLASVDNDFDDEEYRSISRFLTRAFQIKSSDIRELILKAKQECQKSQAEINEYANYLKEHLNPDERERLLNQLKRLVLADNVTHPFEQMLVDRYEQLLIGDEL